MLKCFPSSSRFMCQLNGYIKIQLEPPVIWKPEQLWTGKQVITSILKTVVDTIARLQFSKDPGFLEHYQGIHFRANSKTPGDAWGGVLDGDEEESLIIIR
jgi:DNA-directed RNA polymerase I subunit RPA1